MLAISPRPIPSIMMQLSPLPRGGNLLPTFHSFEPPKSINIGTPNRLQNRRPKLSLDTSGSSEPLLYKSSSLRLDTSSVISPTSRNTFHNVCSIQRAASSSPSDQTPRWSVNPSFHDSAISTPHTISTGLQERKDPAQGNYTSEPQVSKAVLAKSSLQRPSNVALRPIIRPPRSRSSTLRKKNVAFRDLLTETIETNTYTLAHFDLIGSAGAEDTQHGLPSPKFGLPQRVRTPTPAGPQVKRESRTESRWRTAIEAARAEVSDQSTLSSKRNSPVEADREGSDSDTSGSDLTSNLKRRRRDTPIATSDVT